jgi:uncharacterized protein YbjT (DUF2867 family)
MDNLLHQVGAIKARGRIFMTADPGHRSPTVATGDVAATAACLLLDDSWESSGEIACLGPEDLSLTEMAQIISEVLQTTIIYQRIPAAALKDRLTGFGSTDAMAQAIVDMMDAKNHGLDDTESRTPGSSTPTTFRRWCEEVLKPVMTAVDPS